MAAAHARMSIPPTHYGKGLATRTCKNCWRSIWVIFQRSALPRLPLHSILRKAGDYRIRQRNDASEIITAQKGARTFWHTCVLSNLAA